MNTRHEHEHANLILILMLVLVNANYELQITKVPPIATRVIYKSREISLAGASTMRAHCDCIFKATADAD